MKPFQLVFILLFAITNVNSQFDLGALFGGLQNAAQQQNNNNQQQQSTKPPVDGRIDLGALLGGLNGGNQNQNQGNNNNDPLGAILGGILSNTQLGVNQNGQIEIGFGQGGQNGGQNAGRPQPVTTPATTTTTRKTTISGGISNGGTTKPPFVPPPINGGNGNSGGGGGKKCTKRDTEFSGTLLNIGQNGLRNKVRRQKDCKKSCKDTSGCAFWTFVSRSEPNRRMRNACFLMSDKVAQNPNEHRVSGELKCRQGGSTNQGTVKPPINNNSCKTVSGGTVGANCVLPFKYQGREYTGCTVADASDGKLWCSTTTDSNGNHIGGRGFWGHCNSRSCPTDQTGRPIQANPTPTKPPPVNCQWSDWGSCSTTCGPGQQTRNVKIPAQNGGSDCSGSNVRQCNLKSCPTSPFRKCGVRLQTRIVGGTASKKNAWPWLAALLRPSSTGSGQYCGAALISKNHILTAAHCVAPFTQDQISVRLGEYDFTTQGETGEQTYKLSWMKMHENYDPKTFENDIAILKLNQDAKFTQSVQPACLPVNDLEYNGVKATVAGWGTIYFGGPTSQFLQEVNVGIWRNSDCANNYGKLDRKVLDTMLCAGDNAGKDACQGDSGGPLNCPISNNIGLPQYELCGIVSWGARCAEKEFPGVYTRVSKYMNWIQGNAI